MRTVAFWGSMSEEANAVDQLMKMLPNYEWPAADSSLGILIKVQLRSIISGAAEHYLPLFTIISGATEGGKGFPEFPLNAIIVISTV